ncbi:MAG: hypothetical protein JWN73_929 [Betaproteobacteria bacterium]|nr:hypothetical protein [Betaproteobacteria bacterium]
MFHSAIFTSLHLSRLCALLLAASALTACTTASQLRGKDIARINAAEVEQMRTCVERVYATPGFDAARRRLPADVAQATLEQETDPSMAKDPEISAVLLAHPQLQACRQAFLDKIGTTSPSLVHTYAAVLALSESSLFAVMQKQKSWGDHVRDVKELLKRANTELDGEIRKAADGLSQEPKALQARKDETEKELAAYQQTQKALATMRRPVITKVN